MKPRFLFALSMSAVALRAAPLVSVDASQTATPVSPYIYGQFIEHLGRCIYGGIWAEMLEDRKFYYPITGTYAPYTELRDTSYPVVGASPWEIRGPAEGVSMVKEGAFAGEHSPRVKAGIAIVQHDLGVVSGRAYVGYVWAKALSKTANLQITLRSGGPASDATATIPIAPGDYVKCPFKLLATGTTDHADLSLAVDGADVVIGTVSLMPGDNVHGMRRDTLDLLKQLNATVYRWPGGNFTSGYDWRDGIGDRDRRPPRKNPAWFGLEHNDFGTDEFIAFCKEVGAEPMIAVNTGFGDAYSAAQWVQYCNGSNNTLAGGWRARNGHTEPYGVGRWCVGNEMFGPWQLGFMQLKQYELKHNLVADAMRAVDPTVKLTAVGDLDATNPKYDPDLAASGHTWSYGMLSACADHMDYISEHFYEGRLPWDKSVRAEPLDEARRLKLTIRRKAETERAIEASIPGLKGRTVPISMDEWNFWHREAVYGEIGCVYDQSDALGVGEGLHEYYRQTDTIQMAFYAQTVNAIGAVKTTRTAAEMETTGLVLQIHRAHFGTIPFKIPDAFGDLDVAAALTADRRTLTVSVVNPTDRPAEIVLEAKGIRYGAPGTQWTVAAASPTDHNTPGMPRRVDVQQAGGIDARRPLVTPAYGVSVFSLPLTPDKALE